MRLAYLAVTPSQRGMLGPPTPATNGRNVKVDGLEQPRSWLTKEFRGWRRRRGRLFDNDARVPPTHLHAPPEPRRAVLVVPQYPA